VTAPWRNSADWSDDELALFHGTDAESAVSIQRDGIRLDIGRPEREFGQGFYTTTSLRQATSWATKKAGTKRLPAVLEFRASRDDLAKLEMLAFVRSSSTATDFWNFVEYCRDGGQAHGRIGENKFYDFVAGPVTTKGPFGPVTLADSDQLSFHTEKAIAVLRLLTDSVSR
jgi:hypothetical protein